MAVSGRKGHLGIVDMINLSLIREFQVCSVLVELSMWGFTLYFLCFRALFDFFLLQGDVHHDIFRWSSKSVRDLM